MKKLLAFLLTMVVFFSFSVAAMAAPAPKNVESTISATGTNVLTGSTVSVTVQNLKYGSSYTAPTWYINNVVVADTSVISFKDDYYTTTKSFKFDKAGTYTISYSFVMTSGNGKSQVQFIAQNSVTITVVDPVAVKQVTNFEVTKYKLEQQNNQAGQLKLTILEMNVYYDNDPAVKETMELVKGNWEGSFTFDYKGFNKNITSADLSRATRVQ